VCLKRECSDEWVHLPAVCCRNQHNKGACVVLRKEEIVSHLGKTMKMRMTSGEEKRPLHKNNGRCFIKILDNNNNNNNNVAVHQTLFCSTLGGRSLPTELTNSSIDEHCVPSFRPRCVFDCGLGTGMHRCIQFH
jgi:hypothetical protein